MNTKHSKTKELREIAVNSLYDTHWTGSEYERNPTH